MNTSAITYTERRSVAFGLLIATFLVAFFCLSSSAFAAVTASVTTPTANSTVKGKIKWNVSASSRDGIKQVVFAIDGKNSWLEGLAPYDFNGDGGTLDTTRYKDGAHQLKSIVTTKKNEVATVITNITIKNSATTPTPTPTPEPTPPVTQPTPPVTEPTPPVVEPTPPVTEPTPPVTEPTPPPATGYSATALDHARVRITWPAVSGAATTRVIRDGRTLPARPNAVGRYTDSMLWPATAYSYTIKSYNSAGSEIASHGPISAATKALPASGFPVAFGHTSIWGQPIPAGSAFHARNAEFKSYLAANTKNPNMAIRSYGVPVYQAEENDKKYGPFKCDYACDINKNGQVPIPDGAKPDPGTDLHMTVLSADGTMSWDYYKPGKDANGIWNYARTAVHAPMSGNGIIAKNLAGANAANFASLAGLIRPEELAQGRIDHALVIGIPGIASGAPACPATHNVGVGGAANALPEGARLQLSTSVNVETLNIPAWQKTVARALQKYGAYVRDNSGTLSIYGETSSATLGGRGYDGWTKANVGLGTGNSQAFSSSFPWSQLNVINFKYGPDC